MKDPILLTTAMPSEAQAIQSRMRLSEKETLDGWEFQKGTMETQPVILVRTGVGSVNAALAAYIGMKRYHPIAVFNLGTAGAHLPDLTVKTIIIGKSVVNANLIKTDWAEKGAGIDLARYSLMQDEIPGGTEVSLYFGNSNWLKQAEKTAKIWKGNVCFGKIYSADQWNREMDKLFWANETFGTLCEEMEAGAVAHAANMQNIPFLAMKVISNNEYQKMPFDEKTMHALSDFLVLMLASLPKKNA